MQTAATTARQRAATERRLDLHGAGVVVRSEDSRLAEHLHCFLRHCGLADGGEGAGPVSVLLETRADHTEPPGDAVEVARHHGLSVLRVGLWLVVSDGASVAWLEPAQGTIRLHAAAGLESARLDSSRNLIVLYTVMTALRCRGMFGLHAACAATGDRGCLLVAGSGSGKSTLVLGLLRGGWSLVADDSVVLRRGEAVEALGLRRDLYLKEQWPPQPAEEGHWDDVPSARVVRRRLRARAAYPDRVASGCVPRLLVFPAVSGGPRSELEPCDQATAVSHLLVHSHLTELEPSMASAHLRILADLAGQCTRLSLRAGRDLKERPELVANLLEDAIASGC
jgi:hypothetical protein